MFYQAVLQVFVAFNKFLQREEPLIHIIIEQMRSFLKKLLGKFVSVSAIKAAPDITEIEYRENQLPGMMLKVYDYICIHAVIKKQICRLFIKS